MVTTRKRKLRSFIAAMACGSAFLLGGCDPTLRATTENGIINLSTALLNALVQATIQVYQEDP